MRVGHLHSGVQQALANLPVQCRQCEGGWKLQGVDPHLRDRLLTRHIGQHWSTNSCIIQQACSCTTKTALLPASHHSTWRCALAQGYFGEGHIQEIWKYLGGYIASRAGNQPAPRA
eukprot:2236367-Prorocentrum_lima.AAC.1